MFTHYKFEQGTFVAIKDPLKGPAEQVGFTKRGHTNNLISYGLELDIYPRTSTQTAFAYQFRCLLTVAAVEYVIWVADLPDLLSLLNVLQVTREVPNLSLTVSQLLSVLTGHALFPVHIIKDDTR